MSQSGPERANALGEDRATLSGNAESTRGSLIDARLLYHLVRQIKDHVNSTERASVFLDSVYVNGLSLSPKSVPEIP